MEKDKNKKKTLTISSNFAKRIPPVPGQKQEKKVFKVYKKKESGNFFKKPSQNLFKPSEKPYKKNLSRKFAEQ